MTRQEAIGLLKIASEQVPSGIYGIERIGKGYIELLNLPMSAREIKQKRKEYGTAGWKVYANV